MSRPTDHDQFDSILLQASSEIILLIDGETLTVVAANKAACDHLGFERDALMGQEIVRIVSARRATKKERKNYEEQNF